jgi:hypothetical protein
MANTCEAFYHTLENNRGTKKDLVWVPRSFSTGIVPWLTSDGVDKMANIIMVLIRLYHRYIIPKSSPIFLGLLTI